MTLKKITEVLKWAFNYINGRIRREYGVSVLEQVLAVTLFVCHMTLFLLFLYTNVYFMVFVNAGSLMVYVWTFFVARRGRHRIFYNMLYFEVMLHVILATWMVGKDCGFALYCIAIIPIAYFCYYGMVTEKQGKNFFPFSYTLLSILIYILLEKWSGAPVYVLDAKICKLFFHVNYAITLLASVFFMSTFIIYMLSLQEKLIRQNATLEVLSMTDTLTGLGNRRIVEEFDQDLASKEAVYCAILADIDDFKRINDTYGHDCGDAVLVMVSRSFREEIRKNDIVCRWGGEEILVILPFCSLENAEKVAQKIREKIGSTVVEFEQNQVNVSLTYGVAESTEGQDVEKVIRMADRYLYYGKQHGKDQIISRNKINTIK